MIEPGGDHLPPTPRRSLRVEMGAAGILFLYGVIILWIERAAGWTGLAGKTFWDWLDLLVVPLALAGIAYLFSRAEKERERKFADQARQLDRELAEAARTEEQELTQDNQRERALQEYYGGMKDLLLNYESSEQDTNPKWRAVVHAQLHATLHRLDGHRKGAVLRFVVDAMLVEASSPMVSLKGAPLNQTYLFQANLSNKNLSEANLVEVNLSEANLSNANLSNADLRNADLRYADLSGANLEGADLSGATLGDVILRDAIAERVDFSGADVRGAYFNDAKLRNAIFVDANCSGADFSGANLADTDLRDADFSGAILVGTDLRDASNLDCARFAGADLTDVKLNDGFSVVNGTIVQE